jgi:restriction system protein
MPRYWIIAPVESKPADLFDKVWQFDVANNLISIGWDKLGDVSMLSREALSKAVAAAYPDKPKPAIGLIGNMLWAFYHEIGRDDFIIARRGRKVLAAVGKVVRAGFYAPDTNPFLASPGYSHQNFLEVEWQQQPRDKSFHDIVFPMYTLKEVSELDYRKFVEQEVPSIIAPPTEPTETNEDPSTFVLEKYLEDFIVSNFGTIFKGALRMYEDGEGADGQQFNTDIGTIDILAVEPTSNSFVVIELKKGRTSDQVIGQTLRYMGWVKEKLCKDGQAVKGLVICRNSDDQLRYALEMTNNIKVRYYSVSFKLSEIPQD